MQSRQKNPVVVGWTVKASKTKVRTRIVNGREHSVRTQEIKDVSPKFTVRDAAETFLKLFQKNMGAWEKAWVAPIEGFEQ